MKCPICNKEKDVTCGCGFCMKCIKDYTHEECDRILREVIKTAVNGKDCTK